VREHTQARPAAILPARWRPGDEQWPRALAAGEPARRLTSRALSRRAAPPEGARGRTPGASWAGGSETPGRDTTPRSGCFGRGTAGESPPWRARAIGHTNRAGPAGRHQVRANLRGEAVRPREGARRGRTGWAGIRLGIGMSSSTARPAGPSGRGPPRAEASRPTGPGRTGPARFGFKTLTSSQSHGPKEVLASALIARREDRTRDGRAPRPDTVPGDGNHPGLNTHIPGGAWSRLPPRVTASPTRRAQGRSHHPV